jgi:hypothetical protein
VSAGQAENAFEAVKGRDVEGVGVYPFKYSKNFVIAEL